MLSLYSSLHRRGVAMAFVEIYNARRLVESRSFNGNFYMRSDGHVLFWAFGLEGWQTDEKTMSYGPNPQRLNELIRMTPTSGYFLQAVPPNWTLKINEIECPKGGYMAFDICWRSVELVLRIAKIPLYLYLISIVTTFLT
jgi:hypothetical protein